ncbi:hypothetical protein E4625_09755 [Aeromonas hydrophila]|uniref:hypothetical protein n=1 Tax=Aeromonas hydrophila TaxID=644 RepID=UPI000FD179F6|nr:hypothetical protein [Aeromonas hydrophila]AZU48374.1 hypothetical protein C3B79_2616 [Aeromonas hydrophila]QBX71096.1 hypothetical protein E4625_09755 [Aeromonas hydrophila]
MNLTLNKIATDIAKSTGKDRGNTYKTLQTLLAKINQTEITSIEHNDDLSVIVINGIRCERPTKRWVIQSKQSEPLQAVKQVPEVEPIALATPVMKDQAITDYALSLASMYYETTDPEPTNKREPDYIGERSLVAQSEDGEEFYQGGILVTDEPDPVTQEIGTANKPNYGVMTFDSFRETLIRSYVSKGLTQEEAEINANAQLTAFTIANDPELKGQYTKSENGFVFDGKAIAFDEESNEFV